MQQNRQAARHELALELKERGAQPLIVTIPTTHAGESCNGPDDLLSTDGGDEMFFEALKAETEETGADPLVAEAERAIDDACEAGERGNPVAAIEAIAKVRNVSERKLLISRFAALKITGVNTKFIIDEIKDVRDKAEAHRNAALAAAVRQKLLSDGKEIDGAKLLHGIYKLIRRFVLLSTEQAIVVTLWAVHTHAVDAAGYTPYLSIGSPTKRTGKTGLLETLNELVARPWKTGRMSAAVLPRKIERDNPTLLLDESDTALNAKEEGYSETLRGILNTGFQRGGTSTICVKDGDDYVPHDFPTFWKALAGISRLPETIGDRSIVISMKRKMRGENIERFRPERDNKLKIEIAGIRESTAPWSTAHIGPKRTPSCPRS
jgi:hypothetical protein